MSGWRYDIEDRDGRLVPVPRYDSGADEDGFREDREEEP